MGTVVEPRLSKGEATRERILEIAEAAVLTKGFGATSIDEVIAEAGLTKSGFFYHFKDKNALAREMLRRYVATNDQLFDDIFARGRALSDDPLQAFLISLKLLAETMADLPSGHPGCLIASICYQERLFDREVRELTAQSVRAWNARFRKILDGIAALYPPRGPVDLDDVADMLSCIVDGAIYHVQDAERSEKAGTSDHAFPDLHQADVCPAFGCVIRRTGLRAPQPLSLSSLKISEPSLPDSKPVSE
jgi:TetR/AcrR family transcriptional repressor of nem operon